jgi:transcriptional regulator with XRE-family HTH domain
VQDEAQFFKRLGLRIRQLREKAHCSQEDMISRGFSVRYWQKVEAGKPITLRTLLRICRVFSAPMHEVVRGLDEPVVARDAIQKTPARRKGK